MGYKLQFKASVKRDLKKIDKQLVAKIFDEIEKKIVTDPNRGKRLSGEFVGLLSYRIGNYRIIYTTIRNSVLILRIGHRKDVYRR